MKTILTHFDRLMTAITFAEANESELARALAGDCKPGQPALPEAGKRTDGNIRKNHVSH